MLHSRWVREGIGCTNLHMVKCAWTVLPSPQFVYGDGNRQVHYSNMGHSSIKKPGLGWGHLHD